MKFFPRILFALCALTLPALAGGPALAPANEEQPDLPRVLVIGDSVCLGYTPALGAELNGRLVIYTVRKLAGSSTYSLAKIDGWLAEQRWDVIQFNWGLQDTADATPAQYESNLRVLVPKLKATGAKLLWATTTPSPFADVTIYNAIAARVMKENDIPVNDLYTAVSSRVAEYRLPQNVHYNDAGCSFLAQRVAAGLLALLPGN